MGKFLLSVEGMWLLSIKLKERGWPRSAKVIKAVNLAARHCLLATEARVAQDITLGHHGLGVVIHPNTTIGRNVMIWHGVTIAAETQPGSPWRVTVEDNVVIGAGAIIVARPDTGLTIGAGASIGAGAVVTTDVAPGDVVAGVPARKIGTTRHPPSTQTHTD